MLALCHRHGDREELRIAAAVGRVRVDAVPPSRVAHPSRVAERIGRRIAVVSDARQAAADAVDRSVDREIALHAELHVPGDVERRALGDREVAVVVPDRGGRSDVGGAVQRVRSRGHDARSYRGDARERSAGRCIEGVRQRGHRGRRRERRGRRRRAEELELHLAGAVIDRHVLNLERAVDARAGSHKVAHRCELNAHDIADLEAV